LRVRANLLRAASAHGAEVWQAPALPHGIVLPLARRLDSALTAHLREVVAGASVTETELRELIDQADGWARALEARVDAGERKLAKLTADPGGPIVEIADELRRVERLRPELAEVRALLADLETRARELRASWLRAGK
jgi:hypothetical protein